MCRLICLSFYPLVLLTTPSLLLSALVNAEAIPSEVMPDGKRWTTKNPNVSTPLSFCYDDQEINCTKYGRLSWTATESGANEAWF